MSDSTSSFAKSGTEHKNGCVWHALFSMKRDDIDEMLPHDVICNTYYCNLQYAPKHDFWAFLVLKVCGKKVSEPPLADIIRTNGVLESFYKRFNDS